MPLPADFQFSQSSLQDYVECQRRFQLRYLLRQPWPAVEVEPIFEKENFLRQGANFHRMVHQYLLGMPVPLDSPDIKPHVDPDLRRWWENFKAHGLDGLPLRRYPERLLSIRLGGQPLIAKYDLIAVQPRERAVIVDWKTAHHRPRRRWLENHLQTRVYCYLLVRAGASLNGGQPFAPEQIEMVYWFANFPDDPERLPYSQTLFEADEAYLLNLIQSIQAQTDAVFPLTEEQKKCRFCQYRTLCARGERAGTLDEAESYWSGEFMDEEPVGVITDLEF